MFCCAALTALNQMATTQRQVGRKSASATGSTAGSTGRPWAARRAAARQPCFSDGLRVQSAEACSAMPQSGDSQLPRRGGRIFPWQRRNAGVPASRPVAVGRRARAGVAAQGAGVYAQTFSATTSGSDGRRSYAAHARKTHAHARHTPTRAHVRVVRCGRGRHVTSAASTPRHATPRRPRDAQQCCRGREPAPAARAVCAV